MSTLPYLVRLGNRLADGLSAMSEERRERHREFFLSFQTGDGGFTGREGDSDLYYTSFAVRGLTMLGGWEATSAEGVASYLTAIDWRRLGVIDLMNWFATALAVQLATGKDLLADDAGDWRAEAAAILESVRVEDGGYAKSTEGASGSTYHTFLVVLTYQLLGYPVPRQNALVQFLYDRQREDGGFVEIAPMRRSGTNPTAAAAALLNEFGAVDDELRSDLRGFLKSVRADEGGFQANGRVPFADSLSTFTGLLTAHDLDLGHIVNHQTTREWLEQQLEFPTGGFRAATWDSDADVEYTFYGLALLSLLNESLSELEKERS
ncbi:MAG: terpene cyclase/mutase family protein [Planctomycetaceae bacterium]|nr:terpene cyclase/mutase family protein [Planctomycetaceae bacterium]